jgi:ribonucleoside-diphosphate reductase beta chain
MALTAALAAVAAVTANAHGAFLTTGALERSLGGHPAVPTELEDWLRAEGDPFADDDAPERKEPPIDSRVITTISKPMTRVVESAFNWVAGERERLSLLPIRHADIWAMREKLLGLHWNANHVILLRDKKDWVTRMSPPQRQFVSMQLAFFSRIDIDALEFIDGLCEEIGSPETGCLEARMFYCSQAEQECTHAESYSLQIMAVVDGAEQTALLNAARTMPIVGKIRDWVRRWFDTGIPIGERLVAFAGVEGVLFSASFCALQWLREKNILAGITLFNEYIARDEGIHADTTCLLIRKYLKIKPAEQLAHKIFLDLVENIIDPFVREALPVRLIGMNADLMVQYVRFQADCVMLNMGYAPIFRVDNPFSFMDKLALNDASKSNFFEKSRGTDYQECTKAGAGALRMDTSFVDD